MMAAAAAIPMEEGWIILIGLLQVIPVFTLVPRFVLSLRELYALDLRGRCGSEIDTDLGLTSQLGHGAVASMVVFSKGGESEGFELSNLNAVATGEGASSV